MCYTFILLDRPGRIARHLADTTLFLEKHGVSEGLSWEFEYYTCMWSADHGLCIEYSILSAITSQAGTRLPAVDYGAWNATDVQAGIDDWTS